MILKLSALAVMSCVVWAADPWLTIEPKAPAKGKHIVLVSGDEEYRSEELLPQLAKILATRHGFKCTVLFAIDPKDGVIHPEYNSNIPGLESLDSADLMVILTRFRDLPDDQMKHILDYANSGKPMVALRTATHAFALKSSPTYGKYSWNSPDGGFGKQFFGETWVNHHGKHAVQSTRGIARAGREGHPLLRGIGKDELWSPTDVYTVRMPLAPEFDVLVDGQVLTGMNPTDPAVDGALNNPMMPLVWVSTKRGRTFVTTMGTSEDLLVPSMRRLFVNACYWALGLDAKIDPKMNVDLVGEYHPLPFKFGGNAKGITPASLAK